MPDLFDTELFKQVQLQHIFSDGKIFVDCIQKRPLEEINQQYSIKKKLPGFDLKQFVLDNFDLPVIYKTGYKTDAAVPIEQHLKALWEVLTRKPDKENGSLIPLPYPYIVPGGRFGEIYYWAEIRQRVAQRSFPRRSLRFVVYPCPSVVGKIRKRNTLTPSTTNSPLPAPRTRGR